MPENPQMSHGSFSSDYCESLNHRCQQHVVELVLMSGHVVSLHTGFLRTKCTNSFRIGPDKIPSQ